MVRDQYQVMGLVISPKLILTDPMYNLTVMFIVVSLAVVSGLGTITSYGELKFLVTCHFLELRTSGKVHRSRKKMHMYRRLK